MSSKAPRYSLEWMPPLLRLCMEIQCHAESLHEARKKLEDRITDAELKLAKIAILEEQAREASVEVGRIQSEADQAEAKYVTYREGIMTRMMEAARAGESIDREEAGRLVELEIARDLKTEQLKKAILIAEKQISERNELEAGTISNYDRCIEIEALANTYDEAARHLECVSKAISELSITAEILEAEIPDNALSTLSRVTESYSEWINCVRNGDSIEKTPEAQKERLGMALEIATIDSTTLFSQICITLAAQQDTQKLSLSDQDVFTGDLTEF